MGNPGSSGMEKVVRVNKAECVRNVVVSDSDELSRLCLQLIDDAWLSSGDVESGTNSSSAEDERLVAVANNIVLSLIDEQRRQQRQTV